MKITQWIYVLIFLLSPALVFAQPGNPGNGPIGGLIYLLLAGLGVGIVSLRKNKKQ